MNRISGWVVARGGVSRLALAALALGLGLAGVRSLAGGPVLALTGLLALAAAAAAIWGAATASDAAAASDAARASSAAAALDPAAASGSPEPTAAPGVARVLMPVLIISLAFVTGVSLGAARTSALLEGDLSRAAESGAGFTGRVVVTGTPQPHGRAVTATARSLGPAGAGEELLLEVIGTRRSGAAPAPTEGARPREDGWPAAVPDFGEGTVLELTGRLRLPERPAGDGRADTFDEAAWLRRQGVGVVVTVTPGEVAAVGVRGGLWGALDRLRVRARAHLSAGLDPGMAGLFRGFVLGDKSGIAEPTVVAFRRAGTAHLLAVSGLHVGSLAAVALLVARALRAPPWLRTAAAGATATAFMLFTGAGPSVTRATVMVSVVLAAGLAGRGRDGWTALALAAVVVLAREPPVVGSPGFQLSFSAVAALLLLARRFEGLLARRLPVGVAAGAAVSLAASLGTAPVSLLTFGQVSLVGVVANPLVVPAVPFVMALGILSILAGFVWLPLCSVLNTAAGVVIGWVALVSRVFAAAPVLTSADRVPAAGALLGAAVAWAVWRRAGRRAGRGRAGLVEGRARDVAAGLGFVRRPRSLHGPRATLVMAVILAVGAASGAALAGGAAAGVDRAEVWRAGWSWPEQGEVRVLDVGEGAAVLLRTPERVAVLIDAGPPGSGIAGELRRLGVGRLDAVVITHPHADHYCGLTEGAGAPAPRLLVDTVLSTDATPGPSSESGAYLAARQDLLGEGSHHLVPLPGEAVVIGDLRLEFLGPATSLLPDAGGGWTTASSGRDSSLSSAELNAASLVVVVRLGGLAILVPGDAEAGALSRYALPDVDVVVVPHHGSEGAVTTPILDRLTPAVAVVPVGAGNSFGHPGAGTVRLLDEWGAALYRTDDSGWVAARPAGGAGAVEVVTQK